MADPKKPDAPQLDRTLRQAGSLEPPPADFSPPELAGGTKWICGSLDRESLYDDDGR